MTQCLFSRNRVPENPLTFSVRRRRPRLNIDRREISHRYQVKLLAGGHEFWEQHLEEVAVVCEGEKIPIVVFADEAEKFLLFPRDN